MRVEGLCGDSESGEGRANALQYVQQVVMFVVLDKS